MATARTLSHQPLTSKHSFRFTPTSDLGSASLLFFTSALVAYLYWQVGHPYVSLAINPTFAGIVSTLLIICAIFSLCCAIHLRFIGGKSWRRFRHDLQREVTEISAMLNYCHKSIAGFESRLGNHVYSMPPKGLDSLMIAKKITHAIEDRLREVGSLMATHDTVDLMDAFDLLKKRLNTAENALETLIDTPPVAGLAPEEWAPTLERLFTDIELSLRKSA